MELDFVYRKETLNSSHAKKSYLVVVIRAEKCDSIKSDTMSKFLCCVRQIQVLPIQTLRKRQEFILNGSIVFIKLAKQMKTRFV